MKAGPVAAIGTEEETPLWLPSSGEQVFAVLSRPRQPNGTGVVLLHSGTHTMTAAVGRLWARLARRLAASGTWAIRLDFAGSGDSSGLFERRGDGQPVTDVGTGLDELLQRGARQVVVVGHCYAAVPAMVLALERPEVRRLVLVSPPLTWVSSGQTALQAGGAAPLGDAVRATLTSQVARLLVTDRDYRKWLLGRARRRLLRSAGAIRFGRRPSSMATGGPDKVLLGKEWIQRLAGDGVGISLLYGSQDRMYDDFAAARREGLDVALAGPGIEVAVHSGSLHSLHEPGAQELVMDVVQTAARSLSN